MTKPAVERSLEDYILRAKPAIADFKKVIQIVVVVLSNPTRAYKLVSKSMADEELALAWWWLLKLYRDVEKKFGVKFEEVLSSMILSQRQEETIKTKTEDKGMKVRVKYSPEMERRLEKEFEKIVLGKPGKRDVPLGLGMILMKRALAAGLVSEEEKEFIEDMFDCQEDESGATIIFPEEIPVEEAQKILKDFEKLQKIGAEITVS